MKLTNLELTASFIPALREIATKQTSSKVAFNTAKTIKAVTTTVEAFEDARKAIIETRCTMENGKPKVEGTEYVFPSDEAKAEAVKEIQTLSLQETEVEVYPVSLDDLGKTEISAATLLSLKEFITEN